MATKTITQKPTEKESFFLIDIRTRGELTKYKALVGDYLVRGITTGGRKAVVELLDRMAAAKADLNDALKELVDQVASKAAEVMEAAIDAAVYLGTYFRVAEYMGVMVKAARYHRPYGTSMWVEIRAIFKGYDGYTTGAKVVVTRYIEFYPPNKVDRNKLYRTIYDAVRIAVNAHGWFKDFNA